MTETDIESFRTIGRSDAIPDDSIALYYLADHKLRISIARIGGRCYAFDDLYTSTHGTCPLSGGLLVGTIIMSQCDGSRFNLATGAVVDGPATQPLNVHEVREVGGSIQVRLRRAE